MISNFHSTAPSLTNRAPRQGRFARGLSRLFGGSSGEIDLQDVAQRAKLDAISRSQGVIEFDLTGVIVDANENLCAVTGYTREELVGRHHRMLCSEELASSSEYAEFWQALGRGEFKTGEFERRHRSGKPLWLQASYNPILDHTGRPMGVVKFASDITQEKLKSAESSSKMDAISRTQAVIEFDLDGTIRWANENFLATTGYRLEEIVGNHHSIFCDAAYASTAEYQMFWSDLGRGDFKEGEFERRSKAGDPLWLQATYSPILDAGGRPVRVVKFASDITTQVIERRERLEEERAQGEWLRAEIAKVLEVVSCAGRGDLTVQVDSDAVGPVGDLARGVNSMLAELRSVVGSVIESATTVSSQATSIDVEAGEMASRTVNLGGTAEEMSHSVKELTSSITSIAGNGREADTLANSVANDARGGTEAIEQSLDAMRTINESATEIGEIVKVITEISAQTKLLAFNAAIEAARAGQHGRGFAVVAGEIRKLADRAADSTGEIAKLIGETTARIEHGAEVSENAASAFREIAGGVERTYAAINQIATGAGEQSIAMGDVNLAIQSVSEDAERSAMSCDEIARSCSKLSDEAMTLHQLVQRFTV